MFWWLVDHSPFGLIISGAERVSELWDDFSYKLGLFLDRKLPRARVHLTEQSRLGRFLLHVTGMDDPAACEAFWSTVAVPFKTRAAAALGKIYLFLVSLTSVFMALAGIAFALTELHWTPIQAILATGAVAVLFLVAVVTLAAIWALFAFIARYLCPVRFEINSSNADTQAAA